MKIILIPKTVDNDNLLFLNGMRVVSIFWIVFGHDMWFRFMNIKNWMDSINILTDPGISTLAPAAYFAVDVFFWIGGFLVTMGMLEQMKKRIKFIPFYLGCILHRFIRIWPTYMVAILMFWKIAPFFGSGPIWRTFYDISCECNNGGVVWNMFFVDNFGDHGPNGRSYCYGWVIFVLFLGLVSGSRLPTVPDHSVPALRLQKEQKAWMALDFHLIHGCCHHCLCDDLRKRVALSHHQPQAQTPT